MSQSRLDQIRNVLARLMSRYLCLGQCLCLRKKCLDSITAKGMKLCRDERSQKQNKWQRVEILAVC